MLSFYVLNRFNYTTNFNSIAQFHYRCPIMDRKLKTTFHLDMHGVKYIFHKSAISFSIVTDSNLKSYIFIIHTAAMFDKTQIGLILYVLLSFHNHYCLK